MTRLFRLCAVAAVVAIPLPVFAATEYEIEAAANDETFIINGEAFKAQTYCMGWNKGDRVVFVEGDPFGTCVSATLYNLDARESCDVWCE